MVPCPGCPSVPQELSTMPYRYLRTGAAGVSQVLRRLSAGMPWPQASGGPPPPRPCGGARGAFGSVHTLGGRHEPFRSCPSTSGCAVTPTAARIRCRRFAHLVRRESPHDSAMDARRATGGWRALPRQGLAPCKRRQAYLGTTTLALSCCRKREQGTSVGWRQSGAALGSARTRSVEPWIDSSCESDPGFSYCLSHSVTCAPTPRESRWAADHAARWKQSPRLARYARIPRRCTRRHGGSSGASSY
jgi:hypothetical protein